MTGVFSSEFRDRLDDLLRWRRDVRDFRTDPVDDDLFELLLDAACLAPSVGNAQPWRFVSVDELSNRAAVRRSFELANADALRGYAGERAQLYSRLKLSGLEQAPRQLAVFCDEATQQGHGLGRQTMQETLRYSVVTAVHGLWLVARAHGLGVGWVSILDPKAVTAALSVPNDWTLVAYLCIGFPVEYSNQPELERRSWQARTTVGRTVIAR